MLTKHGKETREASGSREGVSEDAPGVNAPRNELLDRPSLRNRVDQVKHPFNRHPNIFYASLLLSIFVALFDVPAYEKNGSSEEGYANHLS